MCTRELSNSLTVGSYTNVVWSTHHYPCKSLYRTSKTVYISGTSTSEQWLCCYQLWWALFDWSSMVGQHRERERRLNVYDHPLALCHPVETSGKMSWWLHNQVRVAHKLYWHPIWRLINPLAHTNVQQKPYWIDCFNFCWQYSSQERPMKILPWMPLCTDT